MRKMRVLMGLAVLTGLLLGACGGSEDGRTFTAADLRRIVLQSSEVPAGVEPLGGSDTGLDALTSTTWFASNPLGERHPAFQTAHAVQFESRGQVFAPDWQAVRSVAAAFDPDGAAQGYEMVLEAARPIAAVAGHEGPISDVSGTERPVEGLGDEGVVFEGDFLRFDTPGVIYVWRSGNVVLALAAANMDKVEVRVLADLIDARAGQTG